MLNAQCFKWQRWQGLPYLTCNLLQPWQHGFFTQQFWPRQPQDLPPVLQPSAQTYRVKQVHGDRVLTPTEIAVVRVGDNFPFPPADGIITDRAQQSVWVASADCTPVLIGDVATGRVAAVHAGWRGTAKKIVPGAIARFLSLGSSLTDLRIALGPAIAGEAYQVSVEVAAEVGSTILPPDPSRSVEQTLAALQALENAPVGGDPESGKARLNVTFVNCLQLSQLGIEASQIAIAPYCTYQNPESFFSYRRTREKKVQWSGIVSNKHPTMGS